MGPREKLALLAQRAGHDPGTLERVAEAALPGFTPGMQLDDNGVWQVCAAVETLAQAGVTPAEVANLNAAYQAEYGQDWRQAFWTAWMRAANYKARHPAVYGISPCDLPYRLDDGAFPAPPDSVPPLPEPPTLGAPALAPAAIAPPAITQAATIAQTAMAAPAAPPVAFDPMSAPAIAAPHIATVTDLPVPAIPAVA